MWQRVQTLYLAISTALIVSMFFLDKAGDVSYVSYWPYAVLMAIIAILDFMALTCWKFRIFQVRTTVLAALLTIALQIWLVVDFMTSGNNPVFHVSAVFPAVSVIFDVLAARGIWADELLVRSATRLRSRKRK